MPAIGAAVWAAGDAVGYVYFDGEPDTDLLIDLFGYPVYLADGQPLGDGCWYVRRLTNLNERASQTPNRAGAGSSAVIRTCRSRCAFRRWRDQWTVAEMTSILLPVVTGEPSSSDPLQLAVAAHLARYRGLSREHTASDLRVFLCWCAERSLDPLAAQRAQLELYVRWCQEVRRFKPSTVSRRTSVVCGFYRTCVIDGILEHSPAEWLRAQRSLPSPQRSG